MNCISMLYNYIILYYIYMCVYICACVRRTGTPTQRRRARTGWSVAEGRCLPSGESKHGQNVTKNAEQHGQNMGKPGKMRENMGKSTEMTEIVVE